MPGSRDDASLHARARELFLEAIATPRDERDAFLAERCGADADLRAEVASLLRHADGPVSAPLGALLDAHADAADAMTTFAKPELIGPYRIVRQLGAGGMGEVYEAWQDEPVKRSVAVKLIRWGMDTRQVVARFESERLTLARMNHPNIARVFDAGATPEGRPYFAMELVDGVPITEYCQVNGLDLRARLDLFVHVCEGVQHAHQNGVIHRDLKPGNVLVSSANERAEPKIIDFGVAKAITPSDDAPTVYTQVEQRLGTPDYMSPEQAAARPVDTRTDVYSLGAILYELLSGRRVFEDATDSARTPDDIFRVIREIEPRAPSVSVQQRLASTNDGASEPVTGYSIDARTLRGDLDWIVLTALHKDPERRYSSPRAFADDIGRHLRHEPVHAGPPSRRYRVAKFVRRHRVGVAAATVVVAAIGVGTALATIGFQRALEAERTATREAATATRVSEFLFGVLLDLDPNFAPESADGAGAILDRTAARLEDALIDEPLTRARLRTAVGSAYLARGEFARARPQLEDAVALRRTLLGDADPDVAQSVSDLAWLEYSEGDFDRSLALHQETLRIRTAAFGPDHIEIGTTLAAIGTVYWRLGDYLRAEETLSRAVTIQEAILAPDHPVLIEARYNHGLALMGTGDWARARAYFERALDSRTASRGAEHPFTAVAAKQLGQTLAEWNEPAAAEALLRQALRVREETRGSDHPEVADALMSLGRLFLDQSNFAEAWNLTQRALEIRSARLGNDHPSVGATLAQLAALHAMTDDVPRAIALYEEAVVAAVASEPPGHPNTERIRVGLGRALLRGGRTERAVAVLTRALATLRARLGTGGPWFADAAFALGEALCAAGDLDAAEIHLSDAQSIYERVLGAQHPAVARTLRARARRALDAGSPSTARDLVEAARRIQVASLPMGHLDLADTLDVIANLESSAGRITEADAAESQARQIRARHRLEAAASER